MLISIAFSDLIYVLIKKVYKNTGISAGVLKYLYTL